MRQPDEQWLRADIIGLDSAVRLESFGVELPLREIYRMIKFPAAETAGTESGAEAT